MALYLAAGTRVSRHDGTRGVIIAVLPSHACPYTVSWENGAVAFCYPHEITPIPTHHSIWRSPDGP